MFRLVRTLSFILVPLLAVVSSAQNRPAALTSAYDGEFFFARLAYRDGPLGGGYYGRGGFGRGRGSWQTDWPDAETHLLDGLTRLTRADTGAEGVIVDLQSDAIMDYPWLYAVEVGRWGLTEEDAAKLREYLLRGGFLMVDDFWGEQQWAGFYDSMRRVFPDRPIVELDETHELLNIIYDLDFSIQIPGRSLSYESGGSVPHWRGIFDDENRLMVAINFNMDMGDAWEHADDAWYPQPMTTLAYRFAINYVIYSMTH